MSKRILICTLGALFYLYDYFVQVTPSVMQPALSDYFHLGLTDFSLMGACFLIPYAIMQIPAGLLLDRYGARRLLTLAALFSALALFLFASTHSFTIALGCRATLGCAAAFSFICAIYLIANWFSHRWFAPLAGVVQTSACIGSLLGLAPIAYAMHHHAWQQVINGMAAFTLALSLLFWWIIEDTPHAQHPTPSKQQSAIKDSMATLKHIPQLWWIFAIDLLAWAPVSSIGALWGVPYLMEAKGVNAIQASHWCNAFWIGLAIGSIMIGGISEQLARRRAPIVCCFIIALISSLELAQAPTVSSLTIYLALFGLGFSAATQTLTFSLLKDHAPPPVFGCLSGLNNMASILGGAGTQIAMGILIERHHHSTLHLLGYQHALLLLPGVAITGLLISTLFIKETHCQTQPSAAPTATPTITSSAAS